MLRSRGVWIRLLAAGLVAGGLAGHAVVGRAQEARTETAQADPAVQRAIDRVYPALVQIHVVSLAHEAGHERKQEGAGSGAIISADGFVVTNHHVAGKAAAIRVILSSKEELAGTLVGTDALADIAVIKLDLSARAKDAPPLPVAKWGRAERLKVGDPVLAMGCPLALSHSVTRGIVANKEMMMPRFVRSSSFVLDGEDVGSLVKWIGHDATIQPGNSGGPLVNLDGEIIGINEIGIGSMSGAIPSEIASAVAKELIEHGKVRRSWIGAEFQPLLKSDSESRGVLVGGVIPGSPAAKAGLCAGDVVLALDEAPVHVRFREELPDWNGVLLSKPIGHDLHFKVRRDGQELALTIRTELRDDASANESEDRAWGVTARELTTMEAKELHRADKKGLIVGSVRSGGPCDQAQPPIRPGDVIVAIGDKEVDGLATFARLTQELLAGKTGTVPAVVAYERGTQRLLTLVEVGTRAPQEPTPERKKPWLAVEVQILSKKLAAALGLKGKKGVRISQVHAGTPAEEAGFKVGDVVTQIDGQSLDLGEARDGSAFHELIRGYKVGSKAEFTVVRDGQTIQVTALLDEAPRPERELEKHEDSILELELRDLSYFDRLRNEWSKNVTGVLVSGVEGGGWASVGGLHAGDLVQSIDGIAVASVKDAQAALEKVHAKRPRSIPFLVRRGIHTFFIELEPTWPAPAKDSK